MPFAIPVLIRVVTIGAGLAGYYAALPWLFPDDGGGANIGAGLIAFAGLALVSFAWAALDARRRGSAATVVSWAAVAAVVAVGWLVVLAVVESDASISVVERVRADLALIALTGSLVLAPAALGAAVGGVLRPSPPA